MCQNLSQADEILKFKSLLDQGIITLEEFEKKKEEILNSNIGSKNIKVTEPIKSQTSRKNSNEKNIKKFSPFKGCLIIVISLFVILGGCTAFIVNLVEKAETERDVKTDSTLYTNLTDALSKIGLNEDEYSTNFKKDETLDGTEGEKSKGYRIESYFSKQGLIAYVNPDDESIISIRYADKDYYKNGKVLANIKDDTITMKDAENYKKKVEEKVKSILKSPSTAKFPGIDEWGFGKKNGIIIIQGYVDSQNSFGATIRSEFQVKYDEKKQIMTSFIFDGKEILK